MRALTSRGAALAAAALVLTLASSAVARTRLEVQDWDCPPAPASCARPVEVRGFPLSYLSDYHGISPVGRASLISALLGEDRFRPRAFFADLAFYVTVLGTGYAVWLRLIRSHTRRASRPRSRAP